jgi:protein-disulfide isomerase
MAIAELESIELPGCGLDSNCARATHGRWGKLPGTDWPLSFVGFAYFQSLAATFLLGNGMRPMLVRITLFAGGAASLALVAVMVSGGYVCGYCLTIHVFNLALILCCELSNGRTQLVPAAATSAKTSLCFAGIFSVTTALLAGVDHFAIQSSVETAQARLQAALDAAKVSATDSTPRNAVFQSGRYVLGPEHASVHLTVVSDYQCPSCRRFDELLHTMLARRDDLSISVRHFPFCTDCNDHIDKTRHANACRAAIAAEAAGIAGGSDAFWSVHKWLFEHAGRFTDEELLRFIRMMNIDQDRFRAALADEATAELVGADTAAADQAGLRYTPTIFINGKMIDLRRQQSSGVASNWSLVIQPQPR